MSGGLVRGHATTLATYMPKAMETRKPGTPTVVWALGLAGETFELLEALDGQYLTDITLEMGDVLWYCVAMAYDLHEHDRFLMQFVHNIGTPGVDHRASLIGAAREVTEHFKKCIRKHGLDDYLSHVDKTMVADRLAYIARTLYWICADRSIVWSSVMDRNIEKLAGRKASGTLGDVRR